MSEPRPPNKITLSIGSRHLAMLDELALPVSRSGALRILIERAYYESKGAKLTPKEPV